MGRKYTALVCAAVFTGGLLAQGQAPDWRRIGNSLFDNGLAGPASGVVERVWFAGSSEIAIQTGRGRLYHRWLDGAETWTPYAALTPAAPVDVPVPNMPESSAHMRSALLDSSAVYAFGEHVHRSEDGGVHWENTTLWRERSLLGGRIHDLAVAPDDPGVLVAVGDDGVFHSADGGRSWSSWNGDLPNFPVTRLLDLPSGASGVRVALAGLRAATWSPGEKQAWLPAADDDLAAEAALRSAFTSARGVETTAVAMAGDFVYTGMRNGEIRVSADLGATWRAFSLPESGPVERFWIDADDPRIAVAALGGASSEVHVLHTINGGVFWDDFTANLPRAAVHGVAADRASGGLYAATDLGVFMTYAALDSLGGAQAWVALPGLPDTPATDVKLDGQGHQLWAAIDGFGVYAALAPHRRRAPRVVSAADLIARAVAPGSLVTVLGASVSAARAGGLSAPVLAADGAESQLQIPFDARGQSLALTMGETGGNSFAATLPLAAAAPAIFTDRDGTPLLLDADSGVMLDAMTPARSGRRLQILAAGLGRVMPEWPTGVAAPIENPPHVAGAVHAYLDREAVEVTRAILAPGYIGFYLIEIVVPGIVNYGPAELYLDVDGAPSNRVRVYIEP